MGVYEEHKNQIDNQQGTENSNSLCQRQHLVQIKSKSVIFFFLKTLFITRQKGKSTRNTWPMQNVI